MMDIPPEPPAPKSGPYIPPALTTPSVIRALHIAAADACVRGDDKELRELNAAIKRIGGES